jgi:HEPN domain-containing protein
MASRHLDWLRQAEADARHARHARASGDYEWSCFAAHQAGEKALKAVFQKLGMDAWGHTLTALIGNLPAPSQPADELILCAKVLDKHYIPTRYPSGFESGAPTDFYTPQEAEQAIGCAEAFIAFCRDQIG